MSENNGVIRIGRKGIKKFAFGDGDDSVFSIDVVEAFQEWVLADEKFREQSEDGQIGVEAMPEYHRTAVEFVKKIAGGKANDVSKGEALDFLARLREQYDELADFFRPKSREKQESPDSSGTASLEFSEEPGAN